MGTGMKWLFSILVALPVLSWGQGNLVPNGGFETITSCPWTHGMIADAPPWTNTGGGTTPDLFHSCSPPDPSGFPNEGVPDNTRGSQEAHTGQGYTGIYTYNGPHLNEELREYLQIQLINSIHIGVRYHVSFYVSLADKYWNAVGTLGAYFTNDEVVNDNWLVYEVEPQIESPASAVYDDKLNWVLVEDTFTSREGGERYMLIGNFRNDMQSNVVLVDSGLTPNGFNQSYYYIDDVSVIALDSIPEGIADAQALQFAVHPNPSTGPFTLTWQSTTAAAYAFTLYDAQGREMKQPLLLTCPRNTTHDLFGMQQGDDPDSHPKTQWQEHQRDVRTTMCLRTTR
jgi:hypothetical protein